MYVTDCSICSDGYAANFGSACDQCSDKAGGIVLMVVLVVFVLIGAAAIASYTMSRQLESGDCGTIKRLTLFVPLQSVKIVIVALQIVTQVRVGVNKRRLSNKQRLPGITILESVLS